MLKMTLLECKLNQKYTIESLNCGKNAHKRLCQLGLLPNVEIKVLRRGFGPVLIEVKGSKLVLGHGLASKVYVK